MTSRTPRPAGAQKDARSTRADPSPDVSGDPSGELSADPVSDAAAAAALADRKARLFAHFDAHGAAVETVAHRAVFRVEDGLDVKASLPGTHSKNLFVKDKRGDHFLVTATADTRVDLVGLGKALGAKGRLSFAKAEALFERLGVTPGSVTPFALFDAPADALAGFILDAAFFDAERAWFHPLENTASTAIAPADLQRVLAASGWPARIVNLADPLGATAADR